MAYLAIDIDDTLYSFSQLARETFVDIALEKGDKSLQRGAYCHWGEWRTPTDLVDLDFWMEIIDACHQPDVILKQTPYPGAVEVCQRLEQEYDTFYVSNRSAEAMAPTMRWLNQNGFPPKDLVCTMEDKKPYLAHCQYIIDDRPKTLVEFVYDYDWKNKHGSGNEDKQRKGFGLFGEYNRALTDIPNVYLAPNWKLLGHYLEDKGVLNGERVSVG